MPKQPYHAQLYRRVWYWSRSLPWYFERWVTHCDHDLSLLLEDSGILLTGSAELKTFDLSSKKRIRRFSGHPGEVTALAFSKDGKSAFSSSTGERQVYVWQCDTGAVFSVSCDQSVVFLDGSGLQKETGSPLKVLALFETGWLVCRKPRHISQRTL